MPDSYDPDSFFFYAVEETIRSYDDFTKRKIRKFRQYPAGLRELTESGQGLFRLAPENSRRCWVLAVNIGNGCKKLIPS